MTAPAQTHPWLRVYMFPVACGLPWLLLVLPLAVLPEAWLAAPRLQAVVDAATQVIPMIDAVSRDARQAERVRVTLGCLWAAGPLWILVTGLACLAGQRRGLIVVEKASAGEVLKMFAFFAVLTVLLANMEPGPGKAGRTISQLYSNASGLLLIGWLPIATCFVLLGFLLGKVLIDVFDATARHAP